MSAWEIREQEDGSAVLVHEGVEIGVIEPKFTYSEPQQVSSTYSGPIEEASWLMYQRREYVTRGRDVREVEKVGGRHHSTSLLSTSIGSALSTTEEVEPTAERLSRSEVLAFYAERAAAEEALL